MNRQACGQEIAATRQQYVRAKNEPKPWQTMIGGLAHLAEQSSQEFQVVLELIQNAVDSCRPGQDGVEITFTLELDNRQLIVTNDGDPFTAQDFDAITTANKSKKGRGKIGYKGIGFKSVARIAESAQIYSGPWHFEFNQTRARTDGLEGAWLVVPYAIVEDDVPVFVRDGLTVFAFPLHERVNVDALQRVLQEIPPELLLFLDRLKAIHVRPENSPGQYLQRVRTEDEVQILCDGEVLSAWRIARSYLETPKTAAQVETFRQAKEDYLKRRHLSDLQVLDVSSEESEIVVAFQIRDGKLAGVPDARLFSYFPVAHARTGLRFLLQGDILTVPARDAVLPGSAWNAWVRYSMVPAIVTAVEQLARDEQLCPSLYHVLPRTGDIAEEWLREIEAPLLERLKQSRIVLIDRDHAPLVQPQKAAWPDHPALRNLIPDRHLKYLYPGRVGYVSRRVTGRRAHSVLEDLGVVSIGLGDLLQYLQEHQTAWRGNAPQWFVALYEYLAQSDLTDEQIKTLKQLPLIKPERGDSQPPTADVFWPEHDEEGQPIRLPGVCFVHDKVVTAKEPVRELLMQKLGIRRGTRATLIQRVIIPALQGEGSPALNTQRRRAYIALVKAFAKHDFTDTQRDQKIQADLRQALELESARGTWQPASRLHREKPSQTTPNLARALFKGVPGGSAELFVHDSYAADPDWEHLLDWLDIPDEPRLAILVDKLASGNWPGRETPAWFRQLYTYLYHQRPSEADLAQLRAATMILAQNGQRYRADAQIFLPGQDLDERSRRLFRKTDVAFVHTGVLPLDQAGETAEAQQRHDAESFLRLLGVKPISLEGLLRKVIVPVFQTARQSEQPNKRILIGYTRFAHRRYGQLPVEKRAEVVEILKPSVILLDSQGEWQQPSELYLSRAYGNLDLETLLHGVPSAHFVSLSYMERDDKQRQLWAEFLVALGVQAELEIRYTEDGHELSRHPHSHYLQQWNDYTRSFMKLGQWGSVLRDSSVTWRHVLYEASTISGLDCILSQGNDAAFAVLIEMLDHHWRFYCEYQGALYHYFYNSWQDKEIPAYWVYALKKEAWLPTTKGLLCPGAQRVYVKPTPRNELVELLGATVPYLPVPVGDPALRHLLGIEAQAQVEDVVSHLEHLKQNSQASVETCARLYRYLDEQNATHLLQGQPLIYFPSDGQDWWRPGDVFWRDYSSVFGKRRAYASRCAPYENLFSFFKALGARMDVAFPNDYARLLRELADDEAVECAAIWKAYLELERDLHADEPKADWDDLDLGFPLLTEKLGFEPASSVFVPDDPERHALFADVLCFVWIQPGCSWREIEQLLLERLKLKSVREYVKEEYACGSVISAPAWEEGVTRRLDESLPYIRSLLAHRFPQPYRDGQFDQELEALDLLQPQLVIDIQLTYHPIDQPDLSRSPSEQPDVLYSVEQSEDQDQIHHVLYVSVAAQGNWEAIGAGVASVFADLGDALRSELMQLFTREDVRQREQLFRRLRIAVLPEERPPELEPASVVLGGLDIQSDPSGAAIYIDGELGGYTPLLLPDLQPHRSYTIRAELDGQTKEQERFLAPGQTYQIIFDFLSPKLEPDRSPTKLLIGSHPPGAKVSIDGRDIGLTPLEVEMEGSGTCLVRADLDGQIKSKRIQLTPGQACTIDFDLSPPRPEPPPGTLIISSEPPGATIWVDDTERGQAPVIVPGLRGGSRPKVIAILDERQATARFTVSPGAVTPVVIRLPEVEGLPVATARLTVYSSPEGASIWVDGIFRGQAPVTVGDLVGDAEHVVKAQLADQWARGVVCLAAGEERAFHIEIQEPGPTTKQIERWAIGQYVFPYEGLYHRTPSNVTEEGLGYDVRSEGDGTARFIEVKSSRRELAQVTFTDNEWQTAAEYQDNYYLYVVERVSAESDDDFAGHITEYRNPHKQFQGAIQSRERIEYVISLRR